MKFRWELCDFRCVLGENRGGLLVSKVVFAKLQPVPESLVFLRKTIGSSPGARLFKHRTAYFEVKIRWF